MIIEGGIVDTAATEWKSELNYGILPVQPMDGLQVDAGDFKRNSFGQLVRVAPQLSLHKLIFPHR